MAFLRSPGGHALQRRGLYKSRYDLGEASSTNVDGYQMDVDSNIDSVRFTLDYNFR